MNNVETKLYFHLVFFARPVCRFDQRGRLAARYSLLVANKIDIRMHYS